MWVERRVEDTVERKVKTEGMGDDTRAVWRVCTRREWVGEEGDGSENTSGVNPVDQGSAVGREMRRNYRAVGRENGRNGVVFNPEAHLQGDGVEGKWRAEKGLRRCSPDVWGRESGEARRDGGEVVRAQQQGRVGLQERDADIVWLGSTRRWVREDGAVSRWGQWVGCCVTCMVRCGNGRTRGEDIERWERRHQRGMQAVGPAGYGKSGGGKRAWRRRGDGTGHAREGGSRHGDRTRPRAESTQRRGWTGRGCRGVRCKRKSWRGSGVAMAWKARRRDQGGPRSSRQQTRRWEEGAAAATWSQTACGGRRLQWWRGGVGAGKTMAALVGVADKEADGAQPLDTRAKVRAEVETKNG
ncbi:hypothetical protein C8J57DRAFT_1244906 [Mycena rebaudengoi]|nr:hypothetical protein C8J57DRAFT_1244906 [Mycena rebaudengoi]